MANGRCKFHGGVSTKGMSSPKKKHQYLPAELIGRFEHLNGDALDNLEESIGIQRALETRLLEQLATGESAEAWKLLTELVPSYESTSDPHVKDGIFNRMKHIIHGGLKAYGVRRDIQNIHDSQRKLTETLTKCRKEVQETYSQEQYNQMLNELLGIIRMNCDFDTQRKIALDIQARQKLPAARVIDIQQETQDDFNRQRDEESGHPRGDVSEEALLRVDSQKDGGEDSVGRQSMGTGIQGERDNGIN